MTTQVNYGRFGVSCYHVFLTGFFAITQDEAAKIKYWSHGSIVFYLITQVNYGRFGCDCTNGFVVGSSAAAQYLTISHKFWTGGSVML